MHDEQFGGRLGTGSRERPRSDLDEQNRDGDGMLSRWTRKLEATIVDHPGAGLLTALSLGILVGCLIKRR